MSPARVIESIQHGDSKAVEELLPLGDDELRQLAEQGSRPNW
jgi:hypothetical protein